MDYFYSKSTDAFYPEDMLPIYKKANSIPNDLIKVSEQDFKDYSLTTAPEGKIRAYDHGFYWADIPLSDAAVAASEVYWVQKELDRVRDELEKVQDSDPSAVGTVTQWREYRKLLRSWTTNQNFPDKTKRPLSPDAKE